MFPENGFTPEETAAIESVSEEIKPYLNRYPKLTQVNLVIEGGVGTGIIMPHITRELFPQALYVGTDLQPILAHRINLGRLKDQVDGDTVERLITANQSLQRDMGDSTLIYANCFDFPLVRDLCARLQKVNPVLVSFNAIGALIDRGLTHYDKKERTDRYSTDIDSWFVESPYIAQLHVANSEVNWKAGGSFSEIFAWIRDAASNAGYATEELPIGVLTVRP